MTFLVDPKSLVPTDKLQELKTFTHYCEQGDLVGIKRACKLAPRLIVKQMNDAKETPLLILCRNQHWKEALYVINKIGKATLAQKYEKTISIQLHKYRKKAGGLFQERNNQDETPGLLLHQFIQENFESSDEKVNQAKQALEALNKLHQKKLLEWVPLLKGCLEGNLYKVKNLVVLNQEHLILKQPHTHLTGLMLACLNGNWEVALFFIERMKNQGYAEHLDGDKNHHGFRALDMIRHYKLPNSRACVNPCLFKHDDSKALEVLECLVEKEKEKVTTYPLDLFRTSCENGNLDEIKRIYEIHPGIIVEQDTNTKDTPLLILCRNQHWEAALFVINHIHALPVHIKYAYTSKVGGVFFEENLKHETPASLLLKFILTDSESDKEQIVQAKQTLRVLNMQAQQELDIPQFFSGCKSGDMVTVKYLVSVNSQYLIAKNPSSGETGLIVACEAGHWEIALFLIEQIKAQELGSHLNIDKEYLGGTALYVISAVDADSTRTVDPRLPRSQDPKALEVLKLLEKAEQEYAITQVNPPDHKANLFKKCCEVGNLEDIRGMSKLNPSLLVKQFPDTRDTPLIILCRNQHWEAALFVMNQVAQLPLHIKYPYARKVGGVFLEENNNMETPASLLAEYIFKNAGLNNGATQAKKALNTLNELAKAELDLPQFFASCENGDLEKIKDLIAFNKEHLILKHPILRKTPLMAACHKGQWEIAFFLIEKCKEHGFANHIDSDRDDLGHRALDVVYGLGPNGPEKGITPYMPRFQDLLHMELLHTLTGEQKQTPISQERSLAHKKAHKKPAPLDWKSLKLHCEKGNLEKLKKLIELNKKHLTIQAPLSEETALMLACKHGHWEVARYLIQQTKEQGFADQLNACKDKNGLKALDYAKKYTSTEENEIQAEVIGLLAENRGIRKEETMDLEPIVLMLNAKRLEGIRSISCSGSTLIFTFDSSEMLNKAKKFQGFAHLVSETKASLVDTKEEPEEKKESLILHVELKNAMLKNFVRSFTKFWFNNSVSSTTSTSITTTSAGSFNFGNTHSTTSKQTKLPKNKKITAKEQKQLAVRAALAKKQESRTAKSKPAPKPNLKPPTKTVQIPAPKPDPIQVVHTQMPLPTMTANPYSGKADTRKIPLKVIQKSDEVEAIKPKKPARIKTVLGEAQNRRWEASKAKWLEYETFRKQISKSKLPFKMVAREALMGSLMQALEALYPTSKHAPKEDDPDEMHFQNLLAEHFISKRDDSKRSHRGGLKNMGRVLRNILRSPFLIQDEDLKELMILFDKIKVREKLAHLLTL